jgi:hypothetical protein
MAANARSGAEGDEEEGGEFADFMADISQEIAQRVASLAPTPSPTGTPVQRKTPTPATDPGVIVDWENIADRMIEEIR